jgi:hypothetical protein
MNIIGISGKKQSGKDTLANFIKAYVFARNNRTNTFQQKEDGKIIWDRNNDFKENVDYKFEPSWNLVKIYSFADSLKEFCVNVLGLHKEQVYGSDADKNSFTKYEWDRMPLSIRFKYRKKNSLSIFRIGHMTARELMQVIGTDIGRKMFSESIWVNATIAKIKREKPEIALIRDVRFKSEIEAILKNEGYIIRLERKISNDNHPSEIDLDNYDWNCISEKCLVVHNEMCSIHEKNEKCLDFIKSIVNKNLKKKE